VLSAPHRLRRSAEFAAVVRKGRRAGRRTVVVHLLRTGETAPPRCGFVVSRAVGSAAVRNAVKRRLRHLMREKMPQLPEGSLLVVRALPPAAEAEFAGLGADLDGALTKLLGPHRAGPLPHPGADQQKPGEGR
jgi:ribonuclease P protein component